MNDKSISIIISAAPTYIPEQSDPLNQKFVWSYEITIHNESNEIIQVLNRNWTVKDMSGRVEKISGVGVVGLQPIIKPNNKFVYKSYCQLMTPQGSMEGYYEMQNLEEVHFDVIIPKFTLHSPSTITAIFSSIIH